MSFDLDLSEFRRAVEAVSRATKKDEAAILNRAGLTVIIGGKGVSGAIQRTPKASKGQIAAVTDRQIAGFVAARLRKKGRLGKGGVSAAEFKQMVKAERARRARSVAYTAGPGWHKAAVAMGGRGVRGVHAGFPKSEAAKGSGKKASASELVAEIINTAPAAENIGRQALQDALNDTARDMVQYADDKLSKTFRKHSAK